MPDALVMAVTDERHGRDAAEGRRCSPGSACRRSAARRSTRSRTRRACFPTAASSISARSGIDSGRAGNFQNQEQNRLHSLSVSDDGERVYVAGTTAGFYILDSEGVAHHSDAELAAGSGGLQSAIDDRVGRRRPIDAAKLPALANDCLHMVVNDDPGLKAFLASNASAAGEGGAISRAA